MVCGVKFLSLFNRNFSLSLDLSCNDSVEAVFILGSCSVMTNFTACVLTNFEMLPCFYGVWISINPDSEWRFEGSREGRKRIKTT